MEGAVFESSQDTSIYTSVLIWLMHVDTLGTVEAGLSALAQNRGTTESPVPWLPIRLQKHRISSRVPKCLF